MVVSPKTRDLRAASLVVVTSNEDNGKTYGVIEVLKYSELSAIFLLWFVFRRLMLLIRSWFRLQNLETQFVPSFDLAILSAVFFKIEVEPQLTCCALVTRT